MIRNVTHSAYKLSKSSKTQRSGFIGWLVTLDAWYRQRSALTNMTDEQLRDIGLDQTELASKMDAPFWDPPIQLR